MNATPDPMISFTAWYDSLKRLKQYGDRPAKGTIAAALIVLERLREQCNLTLEAHVAPGGAQISGMSLPSLRRVLERFGETREFPSEGGRTNRGNNTPIRLLLEALNSAGVSAMSDAHRIAAIHAMQGFLVQSLSAYYLLERIRFDFDPKAPVRVLVASILRCAGERARGGPVAQHLVGAKLAMRFPHLVIDNYSYSAADEPGGRSGDYKVGGTAFHVTVAPTPAHIDRCRRNIQDGLAVFLIVPDAELVDARVQLKHAELTSRVAAESLESFVGQNVSEIAEFAGNRLLPEFGLLLRTYNDRVTDVETDGSLLIELPEALRSAEI